MSRLLATEPVRLYSIAGAAVAIGAYFVPSGAWPLVLALVAAVLGTGQGVRSLVWSRDTHERELEHATLLATPDGPGPFDD